MTDVTFVRATSGGREDVNVVAASGVALTLDLVDGNVHDVTLTGNCTFTFDSAVAGVACGFTLILRQDGTGGRTVIWPAAVKWPGGSAPAVTATASAIDVLTFVTRDGGAEWFGGVAGQDYS